jgi:CheY-like chemotaxis protein
MALHEQTQDSGGVRSRPLDYLNRNVLLLEDHKLQRIALATHLTKRGFIVAQATSSSEAIKEASSNRFGVVVIDNIAGDEMDSVEVAAKIHGIDPGASIMFLSGLPDKDSMERAKQLDIRIERYITKSHSDASTLAGLISKAGIKSSLRHVLMNAKSLGRSPSTYLFELARVESVITPEIVSELIQELHLPCPQKILIVENEKNARDALARLLKKRGYQVTMVSEEPQAILEAKHEAVSIFLMDIALEGYIDGIEVAEEVQFLRPLTSFIFISAYAHEQENRERARQRGIRVGGWFDKPFKIDKVVEVIEREQEKLALLAALLSLGENGGNPYEYLRFLEVALPLRLVEDLYAELELRPLDADEIASGLNTTSAISQEIDQVYDQMSRLLIERSDDPGFEAETSALRERLRPLQRQEASAIKLYVRSQLHFDPRKGRELFKRAEKALARP